MNEDQAIGIVSLVGVLVLVGAALARRRLATATWLRLALIWAAIFVGVAIAATIGLRLSH